ncbi:SDR family NAD(P)-dependent oxidoreductase [Mesorhizobium sp. NPDC059054]|uniref:SDR family NAD(P)-dependent oxidoreductase n=1 Tax=Mesorhizobium sp. NPDC059054 TaxID=3346711 RepID=UPI0036CBB2C5
MARIALITGAEGSLGKACAMRLNAEGYIVVCSDVRVPTRKGMDENATIFFQMDITDEASVAACFGRAEEEIGPVAVLVCCAGGTTATSANQPSLSETTLADWQRSEAVNARGTFLCIREMFRVRKARPVADGRIILTSSTAAQRPAIAAGVAYSAAKAAVIGLARTAALEAAEMGMTVNTIAPGGFDTEAYHIATDATQMARQISTIPVRRLGKPEEFASLVSYLASVEAAYLTGATIDLNGGARMV